MKTLLNIAALVLLLATALCGNCSASQEITIYAGDKRGTYYALGEALEEILEREDYDVEVKPTQGAIDNVNELSGLSDLVGHGYPMALVSNDIAYDAFHGKGYFEEQNEKPRTWLRGIASLYPEVVHIVVREDDEIRSINDLIDKTVSIGLPESGTRCEAQQILKAYHIDAEDYSPYESPSDQPVESFFEESLKKLGTQEDSLSAVFITAGLGVPALASIETSQNAKSTFGFSFLSIGDRHRGILKKRYPYYFDYEIPKSFYGTQQDVKTLAVFALLVTRQETRPEVISHITSAIFARKGIAEIGKQLIGRDLPEVARSIRPDNALQGMSIPLHPTAKEFFEEEEILRNERGLYLLSLLKNVFPLLLSLFAGATLLLAVVTAVPRLRRRCLKFPKISPVIDYFAHRRSALIVLVAASAITLDALYLGLWRHVIVHFLVWFPFVMLTLIALALLLARKGVLVPRPMHWLVGPLGRDKCLAKILLVVSLLLLNAQVLLYFENEHVRRQPGIASQEFYDIRHAFIWMLNLHGSGKVECLPQSAPGRIAASVLKILLVLGVLGVAGTYISDKLRRYPMVPRNVRDHIVICNWNKNAETIVEEIHSPVAKPQISIVVVTRKPMDSKMESLQEKPEHKGCLFFLHEADPASHRDLRKANTHLAFSVIILSDPSGGEDGEEVRTTWILRAIETLSNANREGRKKPHIITEVRDSNRIGNFEDMGAAECVCADDYVYRIMAQCAVSREARLSTVYRDLLHFSPATNEIHMVEPGKYANWFAGSTFENVSMAIQHHSHRMGHSPVILLGVVRQEDKHNQVIINPTSAKVPGPHDQKLDKIRESDILIVMAYSRPNLKRVKKVKVEFE